MTASARLTALTRVGFAVRGLLYLVIAFLILRTGRAEDPSGAIEYLGRGGGRVLLLVIAAGLTAFGIWRLATRASTSSGTAPATRASSSVPARR